MTSEATTVGETVLLERNEQIAWITLNRPEALNSFNVALRRDLTAAIGLADRDLGIRVIVIRGSGDRAFCTGADIKEFVPPSSLTVVRAEKHEFGWPDALAACRKPTIAAIHGFCLGGGLELALCCDIRIASEDAVFALPEVRLAVIPGAGGTQRLGRIVGLGHAKRMILTGERVDAEHALQMGLVSDVVTRDELGRATEALALGLAEAGPVALAYAKEAIDRGFDLPLDDGLSLELDLSTLLQSTADRDEGASAFRERRKPEFKGR